MRPQDLTVFWCVSSSCGPTLPHLGGRYASRGSQGSKWLLRKHMQKYGYRKTAACMLCQKAQEEGGGSWNGELPKETIGHIQSAGCLGQKEVVTETM